MVAGIRCVRRGRKTWKECVDKDMEVVDIHPEWVVYRDMWRGKRPTLAERGRNGCFKNK